MGFQCSLWYLSDLLWPTGTRQVGIAACSLSLVEALLSTHCYLWSIRICPASVLQTLHLGKGQRCVVELG